MKKISYRLRIGIIGKKEPLTEIFLENLANSAIESDLSDDLYEFLLVFKQIPIKIKIYLYDNVENLTYDFDNIQKLDIVILTLNLY